LRLETACNKRQRRHRLPIQPLHIVDEADKRLHLSDIREQAERREADQKALRRRPVRQAERAQQRLSLRGRQVLRPTKRTPARPGGRPPHSWKSPANANSISDSTPRARTRWQPDDRSAM